MYIAKGQSLGVFAYDPSVDGHTTTRLSLLAEVRRAIKREEFVLHFQPKVHLGTGEVVGAEALLRWQHPTRGLLLPAEFIPLAERTGLIRPLTRYVLNAALAEARRWSDLGRHLPIAVNLSARNLLEEHLVEQIFRLLHRHGVPPALLALEITESTIVGDVAKARILLARLRAAGIKVAIDDFGAGFTSLAELRNLPVSELKVDRSFIEALSQQPGDALIVRSVIELSHNLGLTAVAEGVEDPGVLAALTSLGCDVVQGFHVSPALPAEEFRRWYDRWCAVEFRAGMLAAEPGSRQP
jgi:EAL domain-containing protein (putative c-di-GMP-specific phosphodiesterase class I)